MATATRASSSEETLGPPAQPLVLTLRKPEPRHRVRWSEETIDNEHLGKKSSKCCCIYEKPRTFGDSSSGSESSDSDDNAYERKTKKERKKHKHKHDCQQHEGRDGPVEVGATT